MHAPHLVTAYAWMAAISIASIVKLEKFAYPSLGVNLHHRVRYSLILIQGKHSRCAMMSSCLDMPDHLAKSIDHASILRDFENAHR
jgi:hypothetical protein